jgi:hypothetical protein
VAAPDPFLDRTDEQELFAAIVACDSDARVMTVSDGTGRGKSRLLKQLRERCELGANRVPVSLIAIDQMGLKTAYEFVEIVEAHLAAAGLPFPEFANVQERRYQASLGGAPVGEARSNQNTGVTAGVYLEAGAQAFFGNRLPADLEERMRRDAVGAFLQDLQAHCDEHPVVLLLDAYEHVDGELEAFVPGFLRSCVADPERFDNLVVVIAGQHVPTDQLRLMFDTRYDTVVKSVDQLSVWDRPDVKQFLDVHHATHDETDLDYLLTRIQGGWSIQQAKMLVDAAQQPGR